MAAEPLILALDEGTTNAKAILVDRAGRVVARGSRPLTVQHPQAGYAEQDPLAIWQALQGAIGDCLAQTDAPLAAIAISNQRESALAWERGSGQLLGPLVSWQCKRSQPQCEALHAAGHGELIRERSGLALDPMFSAGKWRWLLDQIPDGPARAAAGEICLGTVDSWLLWQLSGGASFLIDAANAALEAFQRAAQPETIRKDAEAALAQRGDLLKLMIDIDSQQRQIIVDITTGRSDVQTYGIDARYQLVDLATNKVVVNSATFARVSFNIPGQQQRFAGERGLRDAEDRAAAEIAENIRNRLASYFAAGT